MFNLGLLIWLRNSNKISDAFESETLVRIWLCCVHICSFWWHKTRCFDLLANSCQKAQMLIEWCHSGFEYFSHISFYCDHLISKLHWKLLSHCVCVCYCVCVGWCTFCEWSQMNRLEFKRTSKWYISSMFFVPWVRKEWFILFLFGFVTVNLFVVGLVFWFYFVFILPFYLLIQFHIFTAAFKNVCFICS